MLADVAVGSRPVVSRCRITSSSRASSVGGTSRPSALAVLRLITSSYLVGACTGRSAGFSPLEDAIDVAGRAAVLVEVVEAVGHQAAAHDVAAIGVDRRQTVPRRKCDDQLPMIEHAPARRRNQAAVGLAGECNDSALDLPGVVRIDRAQLNPERSALPPASRRIGRVRPL